MNGSYLILSRYVGKLQKAISVILLSSVLISCSSEFSPDRSLSYGGGLGSGLTPTPVDSILLNPIPWEIWVSGQDLKGNPISDPFIIKGDELVRLGRHEEALVYYSKANSSPHPFAVKESLVVRIASTQLALDQPRESLVGLSKFFKESGLDVENVEARFAVIFAYAYGRINDYDQSLAWFGRLNRIGGGRGALNHNARQGSSLLIRTVDNRALDKLSETWAGDSFVYSIIAQERVYRKRLGESFQLASGTEPFWRTSTSITDTSVSTILNGSDPAVNNLTGHSIAAFLPLSGRFSNLGQSTLRGIELALLESGITLVARDDMGDPASAAMVVNSLFAEITPTAVIGPLLSDTAEAIAPILRDRGVPQLSLARKELPFYGGSTFQLGASTASQVQSLLNVTTSLGIKRYGIIYPQDSNGYTFLRDYRTILAEMGLGLAYEASYGDDYRQSFATVAEELENSDVQAIFFPDDVDKATVLLSNLNPSYRRKIRILGSAAWDNFQKISSSRTILEGAIFVSPFFTRSKRDLVLRFNEIYKNRYGTDPDFLAAQGFDAATLLVAAIDREKKEGVPFLNGFRSIENYTGLTGQVNVLPNGQFGRIFSVVELTERGFKEFEPGNTLISSSSLLPSTNL